MAVTRVCEGCGEEFELIPGKNGRIYKQKRFCSQSCWVIHYNQTEPEHGHVGGVRGAATNKERYRGSGGDTTYVKEDGRHQHRVLAEKLLGRRLQDGEVVHHEDRNKKNNTPSNLLVFPSQAEHARHHGLRHLGREDECDCDVIRFRKQTSPS